MAKFTNKAHLSYNRIATNYNTVNGEILEVITTIKTSVMDDYVRGDDVTYVISIANSSVTAFTVLTVTDDLGQYTLGALTLYPLEYVAGSIRYYQNGVLQAAPTVVEGTV